MGNAHLANLMEFVYVKSLNANLHQIIKILEVWGICNMVDKMNFPDTVEEFMEQYKVTDTDGVYMSKGSEFVPIFRMKQWFEHLPSVEPERKQGRWIDTKNYYQRWQCSVCGYHTRDAKPPYCSHCGTMMEVEK